MNENPAGYRQSHSSPDYGQIYDKTYRQGYYFEQWRQLEQPLVHEVFERLASEGAKDYLDFACGGGRILREAESYFSNTCGVDVSESMLGFAKERCRHSRLLRKDLTVEPIADRFDVITAFRFFLNAEPQLRSETLATLHGLLRDRGVLVANIHVSSWSVLGCFYRMRNSLPGARRANTMSWPQFHRLLEEHGFCVEETHWYGYLPRSGWRLGWLSRHLMTPVERIGKAFPLLPESMAQGFMVISRKSSAGPRSP